MLALLLSAVLFTPDSSLADRNIHQQLFAAEYFRSHPTAISDTVALDRALSSLAAEWAERSAGQSDAYRRLNAYVPMVVTQSNLGLGQQWAECFAWRRFAVPAFLADVADLRADLAGTPDPQMSFLIRRADWSWASSVAFECELGDREWETLHTALSDYPGLAAGYIEAGAFADERQREYLVSVRSSAVSLGPALGVLTSLYDDDLDGAFAGLAVLIGDGDNAYIAAQMGGRLARSYTQAGSVDRALSVLDLVARSVSDETISRDTLRAWYAAADPERGASRFDAATAPLSAGLVPSGDLADLDGTFPDAVTGEPVDLAALRGQYVLLAFWSVGCGPCFEEVPELNRLSQEGLAVVGISSDLGYGTSASVIREVAVRVGMAYPVPLDSDDRTLMERFGVTGWPAHILIAPDGRVLMEPRERRSILSLSEVKAHLTTTR